MESKENSESKVYESAEELYHDAPCGYLSFTNDGTIYNLNKTLVSWLGFDREEIVGKFKIYDLFKMGGRLFFETHFFPLIRIQGFANEINFEIKRKDGSTFPALINVKEIKGSTNRKNRYRASVFDISDRKKYEQELFNAKIKAEKTAKAKAEFLATISHEIRTPLNAILGIGNLLAKTPLNPKQKEYSDILRLSSENLLDLVNNLLDLSKLEAQALQLEKKPFAIRALVNSLVHTFEIKCKEKGIQLIAEIDDKIPSYITGDPIKLNQILTNLIGNAIKFTNYGHVKVILLLQKDYKNKVDLHFKIVDTGTGIPEDKLHSIFEEFSQASYEVNLEYGGTGLGLSISQKLLQLHNSEINVKSEIGKGSEFSFDIQYEKYKQSKKEIVETLEDSEVSTQLSFAKVLVVEDNPINIFVISEYLRDWKINFDTSENGQEAIEAAKSKKYDIILMDLHMPVINGFEAASAIRNLDLEKQPVILALSATSRENIQSELHRAGIDDFISKPFGPEDLHKVLSNYIITRPDISKDKLFEPKPYHFNSAQPQKDLNTQKSFDLSRFVKMANNKPDFLKKFILNTAISFEGYLNEFKNAVELKDPDKISDLIHKSTMSVYYIQSDILVKLLRECQEYLEDKNPNPQRLNLKIEEIILEFHRIIQGLKEIDSHALLQKQKAND